MDLPQRKPTRIENYDYSQNGAYFITICTQNRERIFWNYVGEDIILPHKLPLSRQGEIARQGVEQIPMHYENVLIDKYVIMPDHIHMILRIDYGIDGRIISAPTVSTIVGSMKRWVSKQIGKSIWQRSYYDHVIRNQQDYNEIWEYIENNPLKWAITKQGRE